MWFFFFFFVIYFCLYATLLRFCPYTVIHTCVRTQLIEILKFSVSRFTRAATRYARSLLKQKHVYVWILSIKSQY